MAFNNDVNAKQQGTQYLSTGGAWSGVDGGAAGQVLTSNGTGVAPSFQPGGGVAVTITGDTGSINGAALTIYAHNATQNCGSSVLFSNAATTSTLNVTDANTNTIIGSGAGNATLTGSRNIGLGTLSFLSLTSATDCVSVGWNNSGNITSGSRNTALGNGALGGITTGHDNIGIGFNGGNNYSSTEASNIAIGNTGTIGESNVLRLGTQGSMQGQQNLCFIAGITGVTVAGGVAVLCDGNGKLGTILSSVRYKENIQDIDESLLALHPVKFNYKTDESKSISYGLIAEEVEKSHPQLVVYADGQPDSVKYHELPALLLKEIQRLEKRVSELEKMLRPA